MSRRPFAILAAVSLALSAAVAVLWVRSARYELDDGFAGPRTVRVYQTDAIAVARGRTYYAFSCKGRLHAGVLTRWRGPGDRPIDMAAPLTPYADRWTVSRRPPYPAVFAPDDPWFGWWKPDSSTTAGKDYDVEIETGSEVWLAHGAAAAVLALPAAAWAMARLHRWRRVRACQAARRCPACGYDLRATPDRCPECGSIAEQPGSPSN